MDEKYSIPHYERAGSTLASLMTTDVVGKDSPDVPLEEYGYNNILNVYRNQIDAIEGEKWKKVRWFINDYDFLVKDPIINRAFYKYWEIINEFYIFEDLEESDLIFHCAEAPGGFIQGSNIYLQLDGKKKPVVPPVPRRFTDEEGFTSINKKRPKQHTYKIFTISLNKDLPQYRAYNLPSYNRNIINSHICITYGADHTGDINNYDNVKFINRVAKSKFYLVTADGGFDEGIDFNHKEQLHYYLILNEILAAITLCKKGGHFILKMFDIYTESSIHMLFLLSNLFEETFVYKPKTSRPTNSEKYIICKGFCAHESERAQVTQKLSYVSLQIKKIQQKYCSFKLFKKIPAEFATCIKEINKKVLGNQCSFLSKAVKLCNDPAFLENYEHQLEESIVRRRETFKEWEQMYNLGAYV